MRRLQDVGLRVDCSAISPVGRFARSGHRYDHLTVAGVSEPGDARLNSQPGGGRLDAGNLNAD